jgi:hypothetical protein
LYPRLQLIAQNMGKLLAATNVLNRNLEANIAGTRVPVRPPRTDIAEVGNQFDGVARLWTQFEDSLRDSTSTDAEGLLPDGVAPGGGDTLGQSQLGSSQRER